MKKAISVLLAGMLLCTLLVGCKWDNPDAKMEDSNEVPKPTHISEATEDGVRVELDLDVPCKELPWVYQRADLHITAEDVKMFLAHNGECVQKVAADETEDDEHIYVVYTDKNSYVANLNYLSAGGCEFIYTSKIYDDYGYAFIDYHNHENVGATIPDNRHLYREPKTFGFATCEEAHDRALGYLEELGLSSLRTIETLYLDHEIMTAFAQSADVQDWMNHYERTDLIESGYGSAYDAYYFSFGFAKDGVPKMEHEVSSLVSSYAPDDISVIVNADGLVFLQANGRPFGERREQLQAIVMPEQILSAAKAYAEEVVSENTKTIDSCALRYIDSSEEAGRFMRPVWVVGICYSRSVQEEAEGGKDHHEYLVYDAASGEQIY